MSYERKRQDKHRLKKLYKKTKNSYGAGAYYDEDKNRLIRYSCHNKWLKVHCRRITRRKLKNVMDHYSGCIYKKVYDYWWELL